MHNCNKANKKEAKLKSLDISREAVTKMSLEKLVFSGSTKTRNPESGNGNGITETETETEYGICERRFQAIDLKKIILAMTMK